MDTEVKSCSKCGEDTSFPKGKHGRVCRPCKNIYQRAYRENNGNSCTKRYEKTVSGFLVRAYRNMQSRVTGVQKTKYHLYKGLDLLSREDFYEFAKSSPEFDRLFSEWTESDYCNKLTPSVDRVDSSKGYSIDNMEWVTHSENSRRGSVSRHSSS